MPNKYAEQSSAIELMIDEAKYNDDIEALETLIKSRMIQSMIADIAFADNGMAFAA